MVDIAELVEQLWATELGHYALIVVGILVLIGALSLVFPSMRPVAIGLWSPIYRFFAGQIVVRKPTQWDARWESWAPELPEHISRQRGHVYPYGTWAKRPGWQRQLVRLGGVAVFVAWWNAPTAVVVLASVAGTGAVVGKAAAWRRSRRYQREVGPLVKPLAEALDTDAKHPWRWIELPRGEWAFVPATVPLYGWLTASHPKLQAFGPTRWIVPILERLSALAAPLQEWIATRVQRPQWVAPPSLSDSSAMLRIKYPEEIAPSGTDVERIKTLVSQRLHGSWNVTHHPQERTFEATHPTRIPSKVELTSQDYANWSLHEVPIGKETEEKWVSIPLKAKTPHWALSAQTGWGKTTSDNVIIAGQLYHGAYAVILDPKKVGFISAFHGLPNVELLTTLRGQIEGFTKVLDEMNRRYDLIMECETRAVELGLPSMKDHPEQYFTPIALVDDEKGSLTQEIKQWWRKPAEEYWEFQYKPEDDKGNGKPGKGDPLPLMEDQQILWRGRAAAINRGTSAQQNNLDVFLNSDMREQYGFKVLSGPQSGSSWRMTFPGAKKVNVPAKKGRAVYGIGAEDQRVLQLATISDEEARKAAEHGQSVMVEENRKRAELLSEVTGKPLWEVSPFASWMHMPAEMAQPVPVHPEGTGTGSTDDSTHSRPDLRIFYGDGEEIEESIFERNLVAVPDVAEADVENAGYGDDRGSGGDAEGSSTGTIENISEDVIVGMAAAAEHCGYPSVEAFKKARDRAKKRGNPIPGETRGAGGLTWPRLDLEEWADKLPRTGGSRQGRDRAAGDG